MVKELTEEQVQRHKPMLIQLRDQLDLHVEEDEDEALKQYILDEWGTCKMMRSKIDKEGKDYFYKRVPVSWDTYNWFCDSNKCHCGKCK